MELKLLETWSKRHQGPLSFEQHCPWILATHQHEVYQALHDPEIEVVFDVAMTGDGKTLAAFLPAMRSSKLRRTMVAYPTNELIRDQEHQTRIMMDAFQVNRQVGILNSTALDEYSKEQDVPKRFEAIKDQLFNHDWMLTNPDLFHLIESFGYVHPKQNPATLAEELHNQMHYMVFDEFHIFGAPQIASVLDAMLFIRASRGQKKPMKFLFLSATPNPHFLSALEKAGIKYKIIEGEYRHGTQPSEGSYRSILKPATLRLNASEKNTGGILGHVEQHLSEIIAFHQRQPQGQFKGLIICNSVFAAKKLYKYLQTVLPEHGISVGENTGLTGDQRRREAFSADLIVATSTVDVGVDFKINFLLFESLDGGSFVQRLGRLGRHEGFQEYLAVALLPTFLLERFAEHHQDGQTLARTDFLHKVRNEIFPEQQDFRHYLGRWGSVQATLRLMQLHKKSLNGKYDAVVQTYQPAAQQVFGIKQHTLAHTFNLSNNHKPVIDELRTFRGSGTLDVWVYDPDTEAIQTLSVFRLLSGTEFHLMSETEAKKIALRLNKRFHQPTSKLYARIEHFMDESRPVYLRYRGDILNDTASLNVATDRRGFYLDTKNPNLKKINDHLEYIDLCTCLVKEDPESIRRGFKLPALFGLYDVMDASGAKYSVAFQQDALLLDTLFFFRKTQSCDIV